MDAKLDLSKGALAERLVYEEMRNLTQLSLLLLFCGGSAGVGTHAQNELLQGLLLLLQLCQLVRIRRIARLVRTVAIACVGTGSGLLTMIDIQIATIHLLVSVIGHLGSALHI